MSKPYRYLPIPTFRTLRDWGANLLEVIGHTLFWVALAPTLLVGIFYNGLGLLKDADRFAGVNRWFRKACMFGLVAVVLANLGGLYLGIIYVTSAPIYEVVAVEVEGDMIFMEIERGAPLFQKGLALCDIYPDRWMGITFRPESQHYVYSVEQDVWMWVRRHGQIGGPVSDSSFNLNVRRWSQDSLTSWLNDWRRNERRSEDEWEQGRSIRRAKEAARLGLEERNTDANN